LQSWRASHGWLERQAPQILRDCSLSPPTDRCLIGILADPGHEDHDHRLWWLGLESAREFDAEAFDPDLINKALTVRGK
jgi:hypothetical protein